jgi:hypothetical protein
LSYDEAMVRAAHAKSFVEHPYWAILSRMLTGTIQSETEEMLASDERLPVNRASVAMCRKILQTPFFDIQQGEFAENAYRQMMAKSVRRSKAQTSAEGSGNGKTHGY